MTYVIFDLLWLEGHSLIDEPYSARRERLDGAAAGGLEPAGARVPRRPRPRAAGRPPPSRASRASSPSAWTSRYQPGRRTGDWLKIKRPGRQEFVVGGWLAGKGTRSRRIGALLLGVYDGDGSLRYVGRVGQRLQPARARPPGGPARAAGARELPVRGGRAPARGVLLRAAAGGRGVVQRVDPGRAPAPPRVPRAARGQGRARRWCARTRPRAADAGRRRARPASRPARALGLRASTRAGAAPLRPRRRPRAEALQPRQGALPRDRPHQGPADRLLRGRGAGAAAPPRRAPADGDPLAGRRAGQVVLPEAGARPPARVGGDGDASPPSASRSTTCWPRTWRRSCGSPTSRPIELHTPLARAQAMERPDDDGVRPRPRRPRHA